MRSKLRRLAMKRLAAWSIDCFALTCYASLLFVFVSPFVQSAFTLSPFSAEAMGFALLTLPFLVYLSATEAKWGMTVGKRILKLSVTNESGKRPAIRQILVRNALKLAPWELAHFSIWHAFMFPDSSLRLLAYATLTGSYAIVAWYAFSLFFANGGRTPYDRAAHTQVD